MYHNYYQKRWNININRNLNVLNLTKNIIFRKLNNYPSNKSTSIEASAFELTTDKRQVESNLSLTDGLVNETKSLSEATSEPWSSQAKTSAKSQKWCLVYKLEHEHVNSFQ